MRPEVRFGTIEVTTRTLAPNDYTRRQFEFSGHKTHSSRTDYLSGRLRRFGHNDLDACDLNYDSRAAMMILRLLKVNRRARSHRMKGLSMVSDIKGHKLQFAKKRFKLRSGRCVSSTT
jgi:hypothetical protein